MVGGDESMLRGSKVTLVSVSFATIYRVSISLPFSSNASTRSPRLNGADTPKSIC